MANNAEDVENNMVSIYQHSSAELTLLSASGACWLMISRFITVQPTVSVLTRC